MKVKKKVVYDFINIISFVITIAVFLMTYARLLLTIVFSDASFIFSSISLDTAIFISFPSPSFRDPLTESVKI